MVKLLCLIWQKKEQIAGYIYVIADIIIYVVDKIFGNLHLVYSPIIIPLQSFYLLEIWLPCCTVHGLSNNHIGKPCHTD